MKRPIVFILLACTLLYMLTGCKENARNSSGETATHSNATYSNASSAQFPDIGLPEESGEENGSYMAQTNFVERKFSEDGSYKYIPFEGGIVYNGGELELYVEFTFYGDRSDVKNMDAAALLFVDGYIQEFSVENDETALIHNVTVSNNKTARIRYSCIPRTYDKNSEKHTIVAVLLPNWAIGRGNFVRNTVVMAVSREIVLNTINVPEENYTVQMKTREKTDWDNGHDQLPFKQDGSNTKPVFHCFNQGETNCYLFCSGKLISHDGKYIFAANNKNEDTVSYFGVAVDEADVGKPLYVLYIPKSYGSGSGFVERTCNYLWDYAD